MDTLYRNYIVITSKDQDENDVKLKYINKKNIDDTAIVYCYKCKIESFKDVIEASKIMLTNDIKVLKTVNNLEANEFELYTFSKIDYLKTILKKNDNLHLMISTLKLKSDY